MPKVQVGEQVFHAEEGKKLVLALEDHGIDILHLCGGNAKCGTCRVEVLSGELELISPLEERALSGKGIQTDGHIRLSCQLRLKNDLSVKPMLTVHETGMGPGPRPKD
jgi:ferredoxin